MTSIFSKILYEKGVIRAVKRSTEDKEGEVVLADGHAKKEAKVETGQEKWNENKKQESLIAIVGSSCSGITDRSRSSDNGSGSSQNKIKNKQSIEGEQESRKNSALLNVPLHKIYFTQKDMSPWFNDTRLVLTLGVEIYQQLHAQTSNPSNLKLGRSLFARIPRIQVLEFKNRFCTLDNRRYRSFLDAYTLLLWKTASECLEKYNHIETMLLHSKTLWVDVNSELSPILIDSNNQQLLVLPSPPSITVELVQFDRANKQNHISKEFAKKFTNRQLGAGGLIRIEQVLQEYNEKKNIRLKGGSGIKKRMADLNACLEMQESHVCLKAQDLLAKLYDSADPEHRNKDLWRLKAICVSAISQCDKLRTPILIA